MFFKRKIRNKVYGLYLRGISLEFIAIELNLNVDDVDEIIDFMNEIYV